MNNFKEDREVRLHLTNISGMGALRLIQSLLPEILNATDFSLKEVYLSSHQKNSFLYEFNKNTVIKYYKRFLPNSVSRLLECTIFGYKFNGRTPLLVMGDLPIRCKAKQIVFLQNTLLLDRPHYNSNIFSIVKHWILRSVFKLNLKYVSKFIVQTETLKSSLIQNYPCLSDRVYVIAQPVPQWLIASELVRTGLLGNLESGLNLFYPATFYPHKNHKILFDIDNIHSLPIAQIILTIQEKSSLFEKNSKIACIGIQDEESVLNIYKNCDALIFPSLTESYGFPLIEAMWVGIPIICSDLEYARSMCGDEAIYFIPKDVHSLENAIYELNTKLNNGWWPDWSNQLLNIPTSWKSVADKMLDTVVH